MPRGKSSQGKPKYAAKGNGANLGFEEKLWQAADKLLQERRKLMAGIIRRGFEALK